MSIVDKAKAAWAAGKSWLRPDGSELPDPTPMELPLGFEHPESIQSLIRRLVTDPQIREELQDAGAESFDDADDFDIPEDDMPVSPHEETFDPMHLLARDQEIRSGTVKDRSKEEIEAARAIIEKHRKPAAPAQPASKKEA